MKKIFLFTLLSLVCASCNGQNAKKQASNEQTTDTADIYTMPNIPSMLNGEQKARWASEHYWDNLDFADTVNVYRPDYTEQAFVDYLQLLFNIPREMGERSLQDLFRRAEANKELFIHMHETAEKYLYDPNSPARNEELYVVVLQSVLSSPLLDRWERIRPEEQLRMALKNRPGTRAADFRYTLAGGQTGTLYGTRALYTLLFINNPGCPACLETQNAVLASPFLTRLVAEGKMVVLGIYPDEDLAEWRNHAPHFPAEWINSYDRSLTIRNRELYDLRAIPTLYLLDRDKTVLLKDVMDINLIENRIQNNGI